MFPFNMPRQRTRTLAPLILISLAATFGAAAEPSTTPLADALQAKDFSVAEPLLRDDVDVNATQPDGMTALHWAVYHDDLDWTRRLLSADADATAANRYGVTPLYLACRNGNGSIVAQLLMAGADPNTAIDGGETVLMVAARTGKLDAVTALIGAGADVNAKERKGQTALMWAAAEGNLQVVDALLNAGADFETPLPSGLTPFLFAVRQGKTDVALRLIAAGVDVNDPIKPRKQTNKTPKRGMSPLKLAIENGHFETAAALLDAGADPNDKGADYTALHAITWVRKPIRGDGDPPPQGSGSMTSLQMVRDLVDHGANVNEPHGHHSPQTLRLNKTGATPFLLAAETGDLPLMKLLLELGADPSIPNVENCTPLLAACGVGVISNGDETAGTEEEAIEAVRLLLELGADINAVDDHGHAAMHGAAYKSWTKMVQFLADNGADVEVWNQKNSRGWTPLKIAQGHRPGNFRPSTETIRAIEKVLP